METMETVLIVAASAAGGPLAWLFVTGLFGVLSGWPGLARRFPAGERPKGRQFAALEYQLWQVGNLPEHAGTTMVVADAGLYLKPMFFFRFLHPPMLIPWSAFVRVEHDRIPMLELYALYLEYGGTLRVRPRAYKAIAPHLPAAIRPDAPPAVVAPAAPRTRA